MPSTLPNQLKWYKLAWETHDEKILEQLFSPDVVYQEKPEVVFNGILELKNYWSENRQRQRNVLFKVIRYVEVLPDLVVDWEASFFDVWSQQDMNLKGMMWMTIEGRRITRLKEYFVKF